METRAAGDKPTHIRYWILLLIFIASTISYGDRSTLSFAGPAVSKALGISTVQMGYILSSFAIAYVIGQVPGGILLDRYGSKRIYSVALALWSFFTLLQGFAGLLPGAIAVCALFTTRFLGGLAAAPGVPANARIVANWFPSAERGTASAIFNATQYFALVAFGPLMGWLAHSFSWPSVFYVMGGMGLAVALGFGRFVRSPKDHPLINRAEYSLIERGGALIDMEDRNAQNGVHFTWRNVRQILANRMLIGVYIGQYGINGVTYFFSTWFPIYLVKQRHMSILEAGLYTAVPAICGFAGAMLGGLISDLLLKRTGSITFARMAPLLVGMVTAMVIVACNYISSQILVIAVMSIAFFGKGIASLGWAVLSDTSPKELVGVTGGIFNMVGNFAGVVTPIAIGYIVQFSGSFDWALAFVAAHCLATILAYVLIVRRIERVTLAP